MRPITQAERARLVPCAQQELPPGVITRLERLNALERAIEHGELVAATPAPSNGAHIGNYWAQWLTRTLAPGFRA
jgi:hypothetical protein